MAKHPLLLLLAVWVLAGGLWLEAEARGAPYGVKLCGREFIRAVIFTCGGSRWRRSDNLPQEAMGDAFPPTDPYAHSQLGEAAGSSDWGVLTKPAQDSYGSLRVTRKDPDGGSLLKKCCRRGCEEKELEIFCKDGFGGLDLFRVMGGGPGQGLGIWEDEDQC
ncbi:PREDICTED: relaxin-3 isoform X2 [Myotis brandtii]|uniref:relaxin-3 isoform X2 n=1 Tax=Myotis brandtii TaxID=109478 RepID=UPI0007041A5E|nr:PREDICTED: relaxin-3 isoform X2 [Myotis brandtii]